MILLVTGGSASGKSEYAENRALQLAKTEKRELIYLATMMPFGEDATKRIERHRQLRAGKGFKTIERYEDIEGLCTGESLEAQTFRKQAKGAVIMLECMSNLTANEMFSDTKSHGAGVDKTASEEDTVIKNIGAIREKILSGIEALSQLAAHVVIVSIDVFGEAMQKYDAWTRSYIQCLGELNQALTIRADEAVEVVYSIPVPYKEGRKCSH